MTSLTFDPDNTLAGGLYALTPREAIRLTVALCRAVEQSVGPAGSHGAVWPGNISVLDGQVALGPKADGVVADLSPDALEFIAPEQFWSGSATPASDVYSIGLLLYTALNSGVMPFFTPEAEHTPWARAHALQNRMKGAPLPSPRTAGRELAAVVEKAIAFQAEDRYASPAALREALEALPEGAAVPAVTPFVPLTEAEVRNAHNYKVDKEFENISPSRPKRQRHRRQIDEVDEDMDVGRFRDTPPKRLGWVLPVILLVIIVAAAIILLRGCQDDTNPVNPGQTEDPQQTQNIHPPVPTPTLPPVETDAPTQTDAPVETPEPTADPNVMPRYEVFLEDVSWTEASNRCAEKGGHLATVRNAEQLAEVIRLAEEIGANYVWLGAYRDNNGRWCYVTGEALDYAVWDQGEPSAMDIDGTREDYLLLWHRQNLGTWSYNDMREDPAAVAISYHGRLAYVCQYDD